MGRYWVGPEGYQWWDFNACSNSAPTDHVDMRAVPPLILDLQCNESKVVTLNTQSGARSAFRRLAVGIQQLLPMPTFLGEPKSEVSSTLRPERNVGRRG